MSMCRSNASQYAGRGGVCVLSLVLFVLLTPPLFAQTPLSGSEVDALRAAYLSGRTPAPIVERSAMTQQTIFAAPQLAPAAPLDADPATDIYRTLPHNGDGSFWYWRDGGAPTAHWSVDPVNLAPSDESQRVDEFEFAFGVRAPVDNTTITPYVVVSFYNAPAAPGAGVPVQACAYQFDPLTLSTAGTYTVRTGPIDLASLGLNFELSDEFTIEILPLACNGSAAAYDTNVFPVFTASGAQTTPPSAGGGSAPHIPAMVNFHRAMELMLPRVALTQSTNDSGVVLSRQDHWIMELAGVGFDYYECVQPDDVDTYIVEVYQSDLLGPVTGYEAHIEFDPNLLVFEPNASFYEATPYANWMATPITEYESGFIYLRAAVEPNDPYPDETWGRTLLATLQFRLKPGVVTGLVEIEYRTNNPPDIVTRYFKPDGDGQWASERYGAAILIDGEDPNIDNCPPNQTFECTSQKPDCATSAFEFRSQGGAFSDWVEFNTTPTVVCSDSDNGGSGCGIDPDNPEDPSPVDDPLIITRTYTITDCALNSSDCTQTITVVDDQSPVIGVQPTDQGECEGGSVTLCVDPNQITHVCDDPDAPGTYPQYQWQKQDPNSGVWEDIAGWTTHCVQLDNLVLDDAGQYRVGVIEFCHTTYSDPLTVDVQDGIDPNDISVAIDAEAHPDPNCVCAATGITLVGWVNEEDGERWEWSADPDVGSFTPTANDLEVTYVLDDPASAPDCITFTLTAYAKAPCDPNISQSDSVTVCLDSDGPDLTCPTDPNDLRVPTDPGTCSAAVSFAATATDDCTDPNNVKIEYWIIPDSPGDPNVPLAPPIVLEAGTYTIGARAEDACGNRSEVCTFEVEVYDNEPPVWVGCPPTDIERDPNWEPGPGDPPCSERYTWTPPQATDNCDTDVTITCERSDNFPCDDPFFEGETIVTYTATDDAGNSIECEFVITVQCVTHIDVVVELWPRNDPDAAIPLWFDDPGFVLKRCVKFEVWNCNDRTSTGVMQTLEFSARPHDDPEYPGAMIAEATIDVANGNWTCVMAKCPYHTLRRTIEDASVVGNHLQAHFVGTTDRDDSGEALIGGNFTDEPPGTGFIDILDYGVYARAQDGLYNYVLDPNDPSTFGMTTGDTGCPDPNDVNYDPLLAPPFPWYANIMSSVEYHYANEHAVHADANGDGFVGLPDWHFIYGEDVFLEHENERECCWPPPYKNTKEPEPIETISVAELQARGMGELIQLDVDKDGWLTYEDINRYMEDHN